MSTRSKPMKSNGIASNPNHNCIRTSQPPIARPYTTPTMSENSKSNNRSNQYVRRSQPIKKSNNSSNNCSSLRNSSSTLNAPSPLNRNRSSRTATNGGRNSSSFGIKSYLNDPTCISLRQQLMEAEDPSEIYDQIEDSQLQKLVSHLKEYEQDNALHENYVEASKSHHLSVEIHEILKIRKKNEINESFFATSHASRAVLADERNSNMNFNEEEEEIEINNDLKENELIALNQMKEFEQSYQEEVVKYNEETEEKIEKLKELHEQQMKKLETLWKDKKPAQYRKPSAQLLQLKTIEKNLALTGDYDRAMILHKETESLTRKEKIDAQKRLVYDYKISKSRLVQKQTSELNQLQQTRQEGLTLMEKLHLLKRQKYENRDKVLQQQKNAIASKILNQASQSLSIPAPIIQEKLGLIQSNLLPELIPPNDSDFVKEEERKAREENKRRLELQKRNIDAISQIYKTRNDVEYEEENDIKNEDQNNNENKNVENEDQNYNENKNNENEDQNYNENSNEIRNDENEEQKKEGFSMNIISDTLSAVPGSKNKNEEESKGINNVLELAEAKEDEIDPEKEADENKENQESIKSETEIKSNENEEKEVEENDDKQLIKSENDENKEIKSENDEKKSDTDENKEDKKPKTQSEEETKAEDNDNNKSKTDDTEENQKILKSEENMKSEADEDKKENSDAQNKNEPKSLLDVSRLNTLIGSADAQNHESPKDDKK